MGEGINELGMRGKSANYAMMEWLITVLLFKLGEYDNAELLYGRGRGREGEDEKRSEKD